ncbi:MAG: hypothetical protein QNJ36_06765 [Calothrix sp. MO_167.B42]|nr:hypothetical protein [Calothrix sp. MO_167.B42]
MANPGWERSESPFHVGELAIQARLGAQERIDKQGMRVIREYLPEQHRQFFAQLPYVIVGTVDVSGYLMFYIPGGIRMEVIALPS